MQVPMPSAPRRGGQAGLHWAKGRTTRRPTCQAGPSAGSPPPGKPSPAGHREDTEARGCCRSEGAEQAGLGAGSRRPRLCWEGPVLGGVLTLARLPWRPAGWAARGASGPVMGSRAAPSCSLLLRPPCPPLWLGLSPPCLPLLCRLTTVGPPPASPVLTSRSLARGAPAGLPACLCSWPLSGPPPRLGARAVRMQASPAPAHTVPGPLTSARPPVRTVVPAPGSLPPPGISLRARRFSKSHSDLRTSWKPRAARCARCAHLCPTGLGPASAGP